MCLLAHIFFIYVCEKITSGKKETNMKKFNILAVTSLSMAISLLSGCTGGKKEEEKPVEPPTPPVVDKFEEVSYNDYIAALEGKNFNDGSYQKVLINGSVKTYSESTILAEFHDEPVRFKGEMTRPVPRPQNSYAVNEYAINSIMGFATDWSEDDEAKFYLNKGNEQTPYMVEINESVANGVTAKRTMVYDKDGYTLSDKSVVNSAPTDPLINYVAYYHPLIDLTFTWCEKDTIDSYQSISYDSFKEKAQVFENATCEYLSGHANGTVGYCDSEDIVTLENDLLIPSSMDKFESAKNRDLLIELFQNRASCISDDDTYYFYYSESLDSLMAIMNMVSSEDILERVITWNNNGLPTSVKDTKYGSCSTFGPEKVYDLAFTYSKEAETITLTILSGVGAWTDGTTQKVITANVGSYLGAAMSKFVMPTCEGMIIYGNTLARENGRLIHYSERIYDDMTLTIPFYSNEGSPTVLKFSNPSSIEFTMQGFDSNKPMLGYLTDDSNDGFYFTSGAKQTLEYTFKISKVAVRTKTVYFYGADVALGDENGLFIPTNDSLTRLTLNGNSTIANYAYANTNLTDVSVNAAAIETIGAHAFENCEKLENLYCGAIHNIGAYAFANTGLTGVFTASKNATTIGEKAFDGCESLTGVLVNSTFTYVNASSVSPSGKLNYFRQDQQPVPEGWNANWNGDAKVLHELTDGSFYYKETAIDVGGYIGGSIGEETFTFAMFLTQNKTYTIHVSALANDDITVSLIDGTEVVKAAHGSESNYDKTVTGVSGGQWIIIEVYGLENVNSSGYFFRVSQEA